MIAGDQQILVVRNVLKQESKHSYQMFDLLYSMGDWSARILSFTRLGNSFSSVQFSSVAQSCPTLCDPMNYSTPGLPVHHQLLEFTQTHVRWVTDAIQPSHPLSSPSPPAPNPFQHQSLFPMSQLFASGGQSIGASASASVLPNNLFRTDFLSDGLVWSPCSPRDSQESSLASQLESINSLVLNLLYDPTDIHTWLLEMIVGQIIC